MLACGMEHLVLDPKLKSFYYQYKIILRIMQQTPMALNLSIDNIHRTLCIKLMESRVESWFLIHQDVYHDLFVCS